MLQDVAQFTAECEKFVGTESGGMDQAISIMGELELAKMVHFHPVRAPLDCPQYITYLLQPMIVLQHPFASTIHAQNSCASACHFVKQDILLKITSCVAQQP